MSHSQAEFLARMEDLVRKFGANADEYLSTSYSEAEVRYQFIDPLFAALGWNLEDKTGLGPARCEVLTEKGGTPGKPDYNFRLHGKPRFFVEAKPPHVKLGAQHVLQAKRYAWNHATVSIAVLTDFEEFRVYDASLKPDEKHPDLGLLFAYRYDEYLSDAAVSDFWKLSREEVAAGSLGRLLRQDPASRRARVPVDKAFLADLTDWRETLAKDAYKNDPELSLAALNEAVQALLDRLIFIRIAEDRRIIEADTLKNLVDRWSEGRRRSLRAMLDSLFTAVNEDLNGEVFTPNAALDAARFDDALAAKIIQALCGGPYNFAIIGVELLGSIYERYLGKTIRVTAKRAVVEEKPEVRKAGGVYYTPRDIVDYIVEQTVGKVIEGRTPAQIAKLRILDPACGSGSFLLAAYQKLIDYHVAYYAEHPQEARLGEMFPALTDEGGQKRLSILEKGRILTNSIFGVDIDPQAIEVTMMSLYIKALEGETTLPRKQALLPSLKNNIKCGNSLIGMDYFNGQLLPDEEEMRRVRPFDWREQFPQAFDGKDGKGFDCVIGNPPYIRIQTMKEWAPLEVELYKKRYAAAGKGNYDIYVVFVERGLSLLNKRGRLGFILPHKFFNAQYGEALRTLIAKGRHLAHVVHFGAQQVFAGSTTYTCLLFLEKAGSDECRFVKVDDLDAWIEAKQATEGLIPSESITSAEWNISVGDGSRLRRKLGQMGVKLGDAADIYVGLQTSADDVFILDLVKETPRTLRLNSKAINAEWTFEKGLLFPLVSGTDVNRYQALPERQYILFPYVVKSGSAELINWGEISQRYPKTAAYLLENKKRLEKREKGRFKGREWYRFGRSQNIGIQGQIKLCVPRLVDKLYAAYDIEGNHFLDNVDVGGVTLKPTYLQQGLLYLLGLLNSKLLRWYFPHVSAPFRGGWLSANRQFLSQLPIRPINLRNRADVKRHDEMVRLVERMLNLHKLLASAQTTPDRNRYETQIAATDRKIDALVYELYGLTEEEIAAVEDSR
jgi:type I restriction-modification system DNA methylase subunit